MSTHTVSDTEWAFLAGLIEADGCITLILGPNGYYHARVQFANQSLMLHALMREKYRAYASFANNASTCFTSHWAHTQLIKWLLEGILPYLQSKKEEANLLLAYCYSVQGQGKKSTLTDEQKELICFRMHQLKEERP